MSTIDTVRAEFLSRMGAKFDAVANAVEALEEGAHLPELSAAGESVVKTLGETSDTGKTISRTVANLIVESLGSVDGWTRVQSGPGAGLYNSPVAEGKGLQEQRAKIMRMQEKLAKLQEKVSKKNAK